MKLSNTYLVFCLWCGLVCTGMAQQPTDVLHSGYRAIVVVPVVGKGTYDDVKRPLLVPDAKAARAAGIQSYSWQPTDDGALAIVEIVFTSQDALRRVTKDARVVKAFEKGLHKPAEVETEIRKLRRSFALTPVNRPASGRAN